MALRGYVLAGGRSSRMGADKARLAVRGLPMAAAVAEVLTEAGLPVTLVRRGAPDGLPWLDRGGQPLRVAHEPDDGEPHPLSGLAWALDDALQHGAEAVLVAPCDLADLDADAVRRLMVAPSVAAGPDGRRHWLLAHVPVERLEAVRAAASRGAPVRYALGDLPPVQVAARVLHNVNRPEDRREHPLQRLMASLPEGIDAQPVIAAEQQRMRQRGIVERCPPSVSCASHPTDPRSEET